jgi:hypothetical protein
MKSGCPTDHGGLPCLGCRCCVGHPVGGAWRDRRSILIEKSAEQLTEDEAEDLVRPKRASR